MRAMLLLSAVSMIGCIGAGDDPATAVCRPGDPSVDAAVFRALTRTTWFDQGACEADTHLPPTCNRVRLGGDGTYAWTAVSDVLERQQAGAWNFRARDATSGVVCLGDGSVVDFALTPDGLRFGPLGLLAPDQPAGPGTGRGVLPPIAADPMFAELTGHAWARTNELDLYRAPTSFALRRDGTFDASFRDGACTVAGTFSLVREPIAGGTRLTLWTTPSAPNRCDLREGGTPAFTLGETPRRGGGILSLSDGTYRDAAIVTDEHSVAFSSYGGAAGLTVSAAWHGALRAGVPTSWAISLRNDGQAPQVVASLHLDLTSVALTSAGFMASGPAVPAADRTLGLTIAPGGSLALDGEVAFTPGPAGWLDLRLEVDSSDSQPYRNQDSFFVDLP